MAFDQDYLNAFSQLYKKRFVTEGRDLTSVDEHFNTMISTVKGLTGFPTTNQKTQLLAQAKKVANTALRRAKGRGNSDKIARLAISNLLTSQHYAYESIELLMSDEDNLVSDVKIDGLKYFIGDDRVRNFNPDGNYVAKSYPNDNYSFFAMDDKRDADSLTINTGTVATRFAIDMSYLFGTTRDVIKIFSNSDLLSNIMGAALKINGKPVFDKERGHSISVKLGFANKYNKDLLNTNINKTKDFHNDKHDGTGYSKRDTREILAVYDGLESTYSFVTTDAVKNIVKILASADDVTNYLSQTGQYKDSILKSRQFESVESLNERKKHATQGETALKHLIHIIDNPRSPFRSLTTNTYNRLKNVVSSDKAKAFDRLVGALRSSKKAKTLDAQKDRMLSILSNDTELQSLVSNTDFVRALKRKIEDPTTSAPTRGLLSSMREILLNINSAMRVADPSKKPDNLDMRVANDFINTLDSMLKNIKDPKLLKAGIKNIFIDEDDFKELQGNLEFYRFLDDKLSNNPSEPMRNALEIIMNSMENVKGGLVSALSNKTGYDSKHQSVRKQKTHRNKENTARGVADTLQSQYNLYANELDDTIREKISNHYTIKAFENAEGESGTSFVEALFWNVLFKIPVYVVIDVDNVDRTYLNELGSQMSSRRGSATGSQETSEKELFIGGPANTAKVASGTKNIRTFLKASYMFRRTSKNMREFLLSKHIFDKSIPTIKTAHGAVGTLIRNLLDMTEFIQYVGKAHPDVFQQYLKTSSTDYTPEFADANMSLSLMMLRIHEYLSIFSITYFNVTKSMSTFLPFIDKTVEDIMAKYPNEVRQYGFKYNKIPNNPNDLNSVMLYILDVAKITAQVAKISNIGTKELDYIGPLLRQIIPTLSRNKSAMASPASLFYKINNIQKARHFVYTKHFVYPKNADASMVNRFDDEITSMGNTASDTVKRSYLDLKVLNTMLTDVVANVEAVDEKSSLVTDETGTRKIVFVPKKTRVCIFEPYSGGPYTNIDATTFTSHSYNNLDNVVKSV